MYKINPSLWSACFLLCSAQVFTVWAGAGPKKGIIDHLPQSALWRGTYEAGSPTIISYCKDICDKVFNPALGNKDTNKSFYILYAWIFNIFLHIDVFQIILFFSLVLFVNTQFSLWVPMYLL